MSEYRGFGLLLATIAAAVMLLPGAARATCDSSAFHLAVTDVNGNPAAEPDGSALPAHRLPDGGIGESYGARITITGGTPPYATGWGGYSLPPGISKSVSSSPGTSNNDVVTISGSSSQSYAASLILTVLDKNGCGPTPADSRFDWIYGEAPTNTGPSPSIPEPMSVGDQPSCSPGGWTGDANYPAITYSYEWRRSNADGTTTTVGSTKTYVPTGDDAGLLLECVVTATNRFGSTQAISNLVRVRYPPKNVEAPDLLYLSAGVIAGNQLPCYHGKWVGAAPLVYSYRWISRRADGDHVVSKAGPYYTPTVNDVGSYIRCEVTATNQDGFAVAASDAAKVVRPARLTLTRYEIKGWRSTGNLEWMAHGGPESRATPQEVFSAFPDGNGSETLLVEITVTNTGDVRSLYDSAAVYSAGHDAVPPLEPGQSFTISYKTKVSCCGQRHIKIEVRPTPQDSYFPWLALFTVDATPVASISETNPLTVGGSVIEPPDLPPSAPVEVRTSILAFAPNAFIMRARRTTCHWVTSRTGKLKTSHSNTGLCDKPIWIRATVHGRKWTVRFQHPLPRGRYVIYTEASAKNGIFNPTFTVQEHNRHILRVR